MNEAPKCACCKTRPATLRLTEPTDASAPKGTLYCDYCSTATSASFEPIVRPEDERVAHLADQRDLYGEQALRSLARLKLDIERAEIAIRTGMAGSAMSARDAVLHHQALLDPVTQATEFVTLWNAVGVLSR